MGETAVVRIVVDDLTHPEVLRLLQLHLDRMHEHSPPGSVFALDLEAMRGPDVTCWTAWDDHDGSLAGALMGCGALKELDPLHAEVKSMRTADAFLGRGVGAAVLDHLVAVARARHYRRLSLETGTGPAFEPALRLYARAGFVPCGPFGTYTDTEFSVYRTLLL